MLLTVRVSAQGGVLVQFSDDKALRARLARVNAEWQALSRQLRPDKDVRMAELRIRRQALTFAVFEAELDAEQRQAIGSRKT